MQKNQRSYNRRLSKCGITFQVRGKFSLSQIWSYRRLSKCAKKGKSAQLFPKFYPSLVRVSKLTGGIVVTFNIACAGLLRLTQKQV